MKIAKNESGRIAVTFPAGKGERTIVARAGVTLAAVRQAVASVTLDGTARAREAAVRDALGRAGLLDYRGRKRTGEPKTRMLGVRVSPEQYEQIQRLATEAGVSLAKWVVSRATLT